MDKPAVLIVGAGALGVVTGYHLGLAGADVTFLVRDNRLPALAEPQVLYCYDDGELKQFSDYQSTAAVADTAQRSWNFVLVTLDGASCRSDEGSALLAALGDAIRDSDAVVICCGMGVREHCRRTLELPPGRVLEGTMRLLSHQTGSGEFPVHPPTDPALLEQADFAYRHTGSTDGFTIVADPPGPARAFAALYDRSGVSRCRSMKPAVYTMLTRSFFPIVAVFDRAGWPDVQTLVHNKELMSLGARAMREILSLPEHGWRGKLAGLLINRRTLARTLTGMARDCLPLDYVAFTRFHHGDKVRAQNLQMMRQCADLGRASNKSMPALEQLIDGFASRDPAPPSPGSIGP